MTFLNPFVLFGLAAAAIPLIIHLFNLRRPKRIDFSTLVFLRELQRSTMRRVRIKQWILLALRILAIVFLVLAFARPTLQGPLAAFGGRQVRSSVALILDNSLSMTSHDRLGEYLAQAKDLALRIIDIMQEGDEIFIVTTAGGPQVEPEPFKTRAAATEATTQLETDAGAKPLAAAFRQALVAMDRSTRLNREIYLLSDLQRSTFLDSVQVDVPPDIRLFVVPIGSEPPDNVGITAVRVGSRIVEAGQPVRIEADIGNFGNSPVANYVASVFLEDERVAQQTVDIAPQSAAVVPFTVTPRARGWARGRIELEDDAFSPDNTRHFVLHVPERRRVLLVAGPAQRTDYLELALSPDLSGGRIAFEVTKIAESALSATQLGGYDAVLLAGVSTVPSGEAARLAGYVQEGHGLLLLPGAGTPYTELFDAMGAGGITGYSGALGSGQPIARFERVDLEHPLFEGVFEAGDADIQVESPDVYFSAEYRPSGGDEQTLISLSNGHPFLQEVHVGQGSLLLVAVAADPRWSDLPVRGFFIPFLYRSIFYLAAGESGDNMDLEIGSGGAFRVPGVPTGTVVMRGPDQEEYAPEQRSLFGGVLVQLPAVLRKAAVYEVAVPDGSLLRRVAVNIPKRESDLATWTPAEARNRLESAVNKPVSLLETEPYREDLSATIQAQRYGVELWNVALIVALFFLLAEMLVAMQWRERSTPAGGTATIASAQRARP